MDRRLTIVIAEDDEDYALILQSVMKAIGWKNPIRIVSSGDAVVRYLSGVGEYADRDAYPFPSVMFLDINMPGTNGFDVLRWIREHPECSVLPTMMLTTSDNENDIQLAYRLGANAYFIKPTEIENLKTMLGAAYEFWAWCAKPKCLGAAGAPGAHR